MSSLECQVAFGVQATQVFKSLKAVGVDINTGEVRLVDEGIFCGMYSGVGKCPEWLGLELYHLYEDDGFLDISTMDCSDDPVQQREHRQQYIKKLTNLLEWLQERGYELSGDFTLPEPAYFIACGTD